MFKITVRPDVGDEFEIESSTRDVLNWEKTTKGASLGKLKENPTMTDLYKIAHFTVQRLQKFTGDLAEFERTCDIDVEQETDDGGEPDPTSAGR